MGDNDDQKNIPFSVSPDGDVYSTRNFDYTSPDKFKFEVKAINDLAANKKSAFAEVQVSLINDTHRMVIVVEDKSPEEMDQERAKITQ